MDTFYVYAYLDPNGTPFYIGRGYENRAFQHLSRCYAKRTRNKCPWFYARLRELLDDGTMPEILHLVTGLSLPAARTWEKATIDEIGRIDLGTGPLTNLTDGRSPGPIARRNLSKASRSFYSGLSPEEKKQWREAPAEWHATITPEGKKQWKEAVVTGIAARTPEEKKTEKVNKSKAGKAAWKRERASRADKTLEEKQAENINRSKAQKTRRERERKQRPA